MNEHELTVEESIMECPTCNLQDTTKNGFIHNRKQRYVCKDCCRQFVENPPNKRIPQQLWDMVDKLILEKIPIAGISRVTETSEPWPQQYGRVRWNAVGEESGKTNHIERFNLTLRQRISRLVRKTLSFSKKIEAHIGAMWNFIHYYNAEISPKLAITTY